MRFSALAVAVFAGIAAAKRGCRHDPKHPGKGWYWIVAGDTLGDIAADFGQTVPDLARENNIPNPDFIKAWTTIVVNCK
ncbi:hypothetical protein E4U58_000959 [Claviceps cyperi]|nr:hypothetical protein E4U58_000959 [Claviceps cyperi]